MTTTKILSAVSAAALLGISSIALAQAPGGSSGAGSTMQKEQPSTSTSPGSSSKEMNKDSQKSTQGKELDTKSQAQQDKAMGKEPSRRYATAGENLRVPYDKGLPKITQALLPRQRRLRIGGVEANKVCRQHRSLEVTAK